MLTNSLLSGVRAIRGASFTRRNLGVFAPALQKSTDPIQQLFIDKIREYQKKSVGGKLVEPTPDIERELKAEIEKLKKTFGAEGTTDMSQFPALKYSDATVDPIDAPTEKK